MQPPISTPYRISAVAAAWAWLAFGASLSLQWAQLFDEGDGLGAFAQALLCLGLAASLFAMAVTARQTLQGSDAVIAIDLNAVMGSIGVWLLFAAAAWAAQLMPANAPPDALPCVLCSVATALALARWTQGMHAAHRAEGSSSALAATA